MSKNDILEFGGEKQVDVVCKNREGIKITFNYVYNKDDIPVNSNFPKIKDDEWFERMSLNNLLNYLEILNSVM